MKKKIFLLIILTSISFSSHAQFLKKAGRFLKDLGVGIVVGAVDQMVAHTGDQQTIDGWNQIKEDSNLPPSYSYSAGQQLTQGDYVGAVISAASDVAVEVGVNADLVALGNSGLTNFVNGDNNAAMIDAVQLAAHASGNYQFDQFLDSQRDINQINREYKDNIRNGMSKEDADKIRIERIASTTADLMLYIESVAKDRKSNVIARRNEVRNALLKRGYSPMEADYLSAYMSIETINDNDVFGPSVDDMLDGHHVSQRTPDDSNAFFDDVIVELPSSNSSDENPPVMEDPAEVDENPQPVIQIDSLLDVKDRLRKINISGYGLNGIELLDVQKKELDEAVVILKQHNTLRVCLMGNSCDIGSDYGKDRVAMQRARNAKAYLVSKGIDSDRIDVVSNADKDSLNENLSEIERKQNRRVYISIIE